MFKNDCGVRLVVIHLQVCKWNSIFCSKGRSILVHIKIRNHLIEPGTCIVVNISFHWPKQPRLESSSIELVQRES